MYKRAACVKKDEEKDEESWRNWKAQDRLGGEDVLRPTLPFTKFKNFQSLRKPSTIYKFFHVSICFNSKADRNV